MADQPTPTDFDGLIAQYGAAKEPAAPAASFDELVARHAAPPKRSDPGPLSGPAWDSYFDPDTAFSQTASPAAGHILDAFGQGAKQGWGSEPIGLSPETEKALRDHGAFNDYQKGEFNSGKALNEALFRPLATTVEAGFRGMRAVIGGGLAAIEQTGKDIGQPRLGREAAAVGEYLTQRADVFAPSMATLAKARDLGVIGEGESGWKGTADQVSAVEEARNRLRPSQETDEARPSPESAAAPAAAAAPTAPSAPAAPPDIHAMAREIDPGTFREYDALSQRKDTFSRWIDELRDSRDQAATADLDKQIAEQQARLDGASGKKAATYRDRLETLNDQREQALEDARAKDSPDMARIRQQLQQTDYRMRDLAPDVTKAYRAAQEHMPEEAAAPDAAAPTEAAAPAAEATTAPAETATPAEAAPAPAPAPVAAEASAAPHVDIAADVAQKLTAAGRPAEEANAVSALYAARYDARAARLGMTAQDLYGKQPLNVEAGGRGRKGEMGRTVLKDGRATIRLMGNADASTFMHETGHQWLEELTGDAKDERATPQTKQDAQTVRDWLGNDGGDITRAQHEKFARGFERYLMEGRAPTQALAGVFGQFKDWLTKIYQTVAKLRAPITDDIRDVFDRLIAKNPDRDTVVAPEREAASAVDRHAHLAETTPPEHADGVADQVREEADEALSAKAPEVSDEVSGRSPGQAGGNASEGTRSDGDRPAGQPDAGAAGGGAGRGTIGPRGNEAAAEGAGSRAGAAVAERARTEPPAGPHDPIAEPQSRLVDKAGNIRLDNLNTTEDVNQVLRDIAKQHGDFIAERRGVVTDGDLLSFADSLGLDPGRLNIAALRSISIDDQIPLGARILAGRKLMVQASAEMKDTMAAAAREGATDADVIAYAQARDQLAMIARTVSGVTAEWGRAGRGLRDLEGFTDAKALADMVKESTGRTLFQLRREAQLGSQLQTASQIAKFQKDMQQTRWQKIRAGILSYFINNLISGPLTHAAYSSGNSVWQLFKIGADTSTSAAIGSIRQMMSKDPVERVYWGEVGAQLYGMVRGMRDGYSPAVTALKSGVSFMRGDLEGMAPLGESALRPQAIPGKVGYVLETPSRSVSAIHTMFYSMNYEAEVARLAYRKAVSEGLDVGSDPFNSRIAELTASPDAAMIERVKGETATAGETEKVSLMEAAHDEALKMVLMKAPQFGSAQYHLQRAVNSNILAKIVMPFMQIGANILREGYIEHSPLGLASSAVRDNLMGKNGAAARDIQAAKIGVGIGVSTAVIGLTAEGILTGGGPSDPNKRAMKEQTGWKPYSIRVGDFYVPYRKYIGPLGPLVAGTADMYEVGHALDEDGLGKAAAGAAFGFAEVIADESWAKGLSNFIDAARHWDRDGGKYLRNLATDFIPFSVGLGQVAHTVDPYRREVRSLFDAARAHIPFASEGLHPVLDVWGQPMPGGTMLSPSRVNDDQTTAILNKLDYWPAKLERKIVGVPLTDQQYYDFTRIAGRATKMHLDQVVQQPGFASYPEGVKKELIEKTVAGERKRAGELIKMQSIGTANDIVAQAVKAKTEKLTGTK